MRLAVILIASAQGMALVAQSAPVFEAASIKLDPKAEGEDSDNSPGMLRAQMTLKRFITYAYDVQQFQVIGGPHWIDSDHYNVTAKLGSAETNAPPQAQSEQIRQALQTLLADRFQLKFHRESKEMSGYALTVVKSGFKLTEVPDDGGYSMSSKGNGTTRNLTAKRIDMPRFAAFLSRAVGRPVEDRTHIAGIYSFTLEWMSDDLKNVTADQPALPSLFTAIQEQLGLKLDPRKVPAEILVVDGAERPSEN
jgi:uncharacterized protein (TIGR03435 family)